MCLWNICRGGRLLRMRRLWGRCVTRSSSQITSLTQLAFGSYDKITFGHETNLRGRTVCVSLRRCSLIEMHIKLIFIHCFSLPSSTLFKVFTVLSFWSISLNINSPVRKQSLQNLNINLFERKSAVQCLLYVLSYFTSIPLGNEQPSWSARQHQLFLTESRWIKMCQTMLRNFFDMLPEVINVCHPHISTEVKSSEMVLSLVMIYSWIIQWHLFLRSSTLSRFFLKYVTCHFKLLKMFSWKPLCFSLLCPYILYFSQFWITVVN